MKGETVSLDKILYGKRVKHNWKIKHDISDKVVRGVNAIKLTRGGV
jgi:hypothetical protein